MLGALLLSYLVLVFNFSCPWRIQLYAFRWKGIVLQDRRQQDYGKKKVTECLQKVSPPGTYQFLGREVGGSDK